MKDNLKTVQAIYEAFGRGDIPAIMAHLSNDVQWESWSGNTAQNAGVPWLRPKTGKQGVGEFFQVIGSQLKFHDFQVLSLMSGGNQVASEIKFAADVLPTGHHVKDEEMHLWTFNEEGKVVRFRHYLDTHKHMVAAGVLQNA